MNYALVASDSSAHDHLGLAARYARKLAPILSRSDHEYSLWYVAANHTRRDGEARLQSADCIVFFTHGCRFGDHCRTDCDANEPNEATRCVRADSKQILFNNTDLQRFSSKIVFGATTCYLAALFERSDVADTFRGFLGYRDAYSHVNLDVGDRNPFVSIIRCALEEFGRGQTIEDVHEQVRRLHQEWLSGQHGITDDWFLVTMCLEDNLRGLTFVGC
jgi:hypothetical protein